VKRTWIALALLAGSWLFGVGYYRDPNGPVWLALVAGGTLLLAGPDPAPLPPVHGVLAAVALIPALIVMPWPYRIIPCLLALAMVLQHLPIPRRYPRKAAGAFWEAGLVLLVQALAFWVYEWGTARSHELPRIVGRLIDTGVRVLGADCAYTGQAVALHTMRKVHMVGATWGAFVDPLTVCFVAGAFAVLILRQRCFDWPPLAVAGLVALWIPVRGGLMAALLLHRALVTDYEAPLRLMAQLWNPWLLLALLAGPVALCWRLAPANPRPAGEESRSTRLAARGLAALSLCGLCGAFLAAGILWDPAGKRKPGRVFVDECHSTWEPTQKPFDTTWYGHDAGYNYACIYDYLSRFYETSRLTTNLTDAVLDECDVLMLKVPTSPYRAEELDAIEHFVERGGGVLLIGEHTDVYRTTSHLNQVARLFGFEFRKDCLFGIESEFDQLYLPRSVPHPIVQHMPPLDFAVSCSIAPRRGHVGRAVIRDTGLWSLPSDYHASNFYPQVVDRLEARFGAFIQIWTARFGKGRIVAFADSTVFSNFSAFEPGKSEVMLGMVEWLNRKDRFPHSRVWFILLGALAGVAAATLKARPDVRLLLSAGLLGWAIACPVVRAAHRSAFSLPNAVRPLTRIVLDRTMSRAPLSKSGFIKASAQGFGIFEQWILRLGYFTSRREGREAFAGNAIVFLQPNRHASSEFRQAVADFVKDGGKVLVLDSSLNTNSTANSVLYPFGLSFSRDAELRGTLEPPQTWPAVPVESVRPVSGGEPLARLNGQTVAASVRHGKGEVIAVGFGARFNDDSMGITTDIEPGPDLRKVFDLEFRLLRRLIEEGERKTDASGPPSARASAP
jgi:hypothetical protein